MQLSRVTSKNQPQNMLVRPLAQPLTLALSRVPCCATAFATTSASLVSRASLSPPVSPVSPPPPPSPPHLPAPPNSPDSPSSPPLNPPSPPSPLMPPGAPLASLVDISCAPPGTFVCLDSASRGWDPIEHHAVVGGCDVSVGHSDGLVRDDGSVPVDHEPSAGECNEPDNPSGSRVNCERGFDCTMCGVDYKARDGGWQKVPSTACSDVGFGCISQIHNFECCKAYCSAFGKTGVGCDECV